jgi:o-succinylbenzoate synthase
VIQLTRIDLPLKRPFVSAKGSTTHRSGLLIRLASGPVVGWGEASPLPGLSRETIDDVSAELSPLAGKPLTLPTSPEALNPWVHAHCRTPAARHGLASAILDCMAQRAGLPICGLMNKRNHREVPVSHLYTDEDTLLHAVMLGAQTIKLKVGIAPLVDELARVEAIRDIIGPDVQLRLDANGGWTEAQAGTALEALAPFNIHSIEDPVPAHDLDAMARLRGRGVDIIADEWVDSPAALSAIIESGAADVIVIKPMRVGSPITALGMMAMAEKAGLDCFVTTTIDGAVARMMALHIATAAPVRSLRACGLNTGGWLAEDVGQTPEWSGSHVNAPKGAGLGIEVRP